MNYTDDLSEFRRLHDEMVNQPENRELEAAADLIIRRHYNDRDFMLEAIKTDPNVVDQLDPGLKNDSSFIDEIVSNNPEFDWGSHEINSTINTLNENNTQGEQSMDDIIKEQTEAMYDTRDEMIQDYLNQNQSQPDASNTVEAPVASPVEPTPAPEEVKVQDVDNTDTADLSASITDFTSYLKDGIGKIEEINENLNQVVFPETHLENYFSLEDYFKAEKNLPFGDKNFADLTNEEKSNLTFLYRRDMDNDRNKIISMIKDKYNNQKNSFVNAINSKTKQVSRLVESFVHEMTSKKESAEMKLKWALQDFEELENERKTPTTSFERAQEILDLERNLQKEIDSYRSSISNYAGLIGLGKSYGELAADISARVADGKLELNDQLKELDSIYETLQNPDKVKEFAETSRVKAGEPAPVVEEPIPEPVQELEVKEEPVKEEPEKAEETPVVAEEPEVKEEEQNKEETKEPVKEEKVEPKKAEEKEDDRVFTPEAPGINLDPRKVTRPEAKAVIASRRSFNKTAMTVPVAIGLGLALISTSPVSTLTVPLGLTFGAMAGGNAILTKALHDKLQEYFLKRKLDQLAANYDAEVVYDYENHQAHFGVYDEKEDKYKIIKKYEDLEKRLARRLKEEGSLDPSGEAEELGNKYAAQFKKLSRGGELISSNIEYILTPLFDRVGGVTPAVPIATQIIEPAIEQGRKFFGKKKEQFLKLISNKEKYNLNEEQIERIEKDAELADKVVNRGVFKGSNVVRKASELKDKLMNSRVAEILKNRNDEEFYEDEFEEDLENQRSEEVKQFVEEQNIDEEFAPEVPAEEAPVEETPVQVTKEDRQKEIEDSLYEDDLAKESAELQNDEVIDVENTNTYNPKVSYDEYNRWIDSLRNSESELDALHVSIGLDENLSEAEKQALQSKIEFLVSSTKVEDTGRSL